MVSFEIDPGLIAPLVPDGTTLDSHHGGTLVTLVGLRFLNLRVAGIPVPGFQDFDQVNFRFYVRREAGAEIRRGVVFIKEIVPSLSMALGARLLVNENYVAAPMRHEITGGEHGWAVYEWQLADRWNRLRARRGGPAALPPPESIESFVLDRPWGYSRQTDGATLELRVEHPPWAVSLADSALDCDVAAVFGPPFAAPLARPPVSAFIAAGSETVIYPPRPLRN
jgi:uncharacterized protein